VVTAATSELLLTVDKHHVAGLVVLVVGAAIAVFGAVRVVQRLSGAALILTAGIAVAVIGILVFTHTIHA
jgi:hypothetical protein